MNLADFIRHRLGLAFLCFIFVTFCIAMVVPVEYLPFDTRYDKIQHAGFFAVLCLGSILCFRINPWILGLILCVFAGLSEIMQSLLTYRSGSWEDLYADLIGIFLSCLLAQLILLVRRAVKAFQS